MEKVYLLWLATESNAPPCPRLLGAYSSPELAIKAEENYLQNNPKTPTDSTYMTQASIDANHMEVA